MMQSPRGLTAAVAVAALATTPLSCAKWGKEVNYGGLVQESRSVRFEHDIQLFRVKNGLTVALAPDDGTNLVTVDVRYLAGAAEDPAKRAGLAHLVEHLTFEARAGSGEPTLGDRLAQAALSYNAWTNWDETHYTATALDDQLDALLDVESERMQLACAQLDDAIFARERDVVLQEEAQRDHSPLGLQLVADAFGKDHPYARPIGGREIADVTRDEVCKFIDDHYAPDRAILVISGRFDVDSVTGRVAARFGPIKHQAAGDRVAIQPPILQGGAARHVADVDHPTALVMFDHPAWGADDSVAHDLATTLLGYELRATDAKHDWVRDTFIGRLGGWRAAVTVIGVEVDDESQIPKAVAAIDAAVKEVLSTQYSSRWLHKLIAENLTAYAASYERVTSRASWIADFIQYTTHGGLMIPEMERLRTIKPGQVGDYLKDLIDDDRFTVTLIPDPVEGDDDATAALSASSRVHDLQPWRVPVDAAEATTAMADDHTRVTASIDRFTLDNGLEVVLAPDRTAPLVDIRVVYPVGTAADGERRGLAQASAYLLDHDLDGYLERSDYDKLEWAVNVGTSVSFEVDETSTMFRARGLSTFADWHVWRLAWLLDAGVYSDEAIKNLRAEVAEWDEPDADESLALRQALFGKDHPYAGAPADAAAYAKITRRELEAFRFSYYRANGATLIITGDFELEAMKRVVGNLFGGWSSDKPLVAPEIPKVKLATKPEWIGLRDADRRQVGVTVAFTSVSHANKDRAARMILAEILTDRVRAVREGLGASYGVTARYFAGAAGGAVAVEGEVDPARAGAALRAILEGVDAARGDAAALAEDFVRARRRVLARVLASSTETTQLADELEYIAENDLSAGYFTWLVKQVTTTTVDDVVALAARDLDPSRIVVVVVGPGDAVEGAFKEVGEAGRVSDASDASQD